MFDLAKYPALVAFMEQHQLALAWSESEQEIFSVQFFGTRVSASCYPESFHRIQGLGSSQTQALNNYLKHIAGGKLAKETINQHEEIICNLVPDLREPQEEQSQEPSRCMLVAQFL